MREHVRPDEQESEQAAAPPARSDDRAALALQLQRSAGNQATGQMLQRFGVIPVVVAGKAFDYAWSEFVEYNQESARYHTIDPEWRKLAIEYSHVNAADGYYIRLALKRLPDFWVGGWILEQAGSATHAITLNTNVFFNPESAGEPNVDTYVHELVHVAQYGLQGVKGFLGTYAAEFVKGFIGSGGDDTEAYHAIRHEKQAAAVEGRFKAWREQKEREDAAKPKPKDPLTEADDAMRAPMPEVGAFPLGGSVGAKGDNRPEDIERVAARLHKLGFLDPMTTEIDAVTEAIEDYQYRVLGWPRPDGRVDPGNKTHTALKAGRKGTSMQLGR